MKSWSLLRRGRPAWLTSLPTHEKPGVVAFLVAIVRAMALTAATMLVLFPVFRAAHDGGFDFSAKEGFLFALIFAFFEEHARWNFVVNAKRPFVAATTFAVLISVLEQLMFFFGPSTEAGFWQLAALRIPSVLLHFLLSYVAASFAYRRQAVMFAIFIVVVCAHAAFNFIGVAALIAERLAS